MDTWQNHDEIQRNHKKVDKQDQQQSWYKDLTHKCSRSKTTKKAIKQFKTIKNGQIQLKMTKNDKFGQEKSVDHFEMCFPFFEWIPDETRQIMTKSDVKWTMLATPNNNNNNKAKLRTLRINARGQKFRQIGSKLLKIGTIQNWYPIVVYAVIGCNVSKKPSTIIELKYR